MSESLAFVADWVGLTIVDVSDPLAPVQVGHLDTPGRAFGVFVSGGLGFVADDSGGLLIVDLGLVTATATSTSTPMPSSAGKIAYPYWAIYA